MWFTHTHPFRATINQCWAAAEGGERIRQSRADLHGQLLPSPHHRLDTRGLHWATAASWSHREETRFTTNPNISCNSMLLYILSWDTLFLKSFNTVVNMKQIWWILLTYCYIRLCLWMVFSLRGLKKSRSTFCSSGDQQHHYSECFDVLLCEWRGDWDLPLHRSQRQRLPDCCG